MRVSVKTLKGNHFDIDVNDLDTVMAVKQQIEDIQGKESFPCSQQLLIYKGKVLKDETTMQDNNVAENGFLVVMLTKNKASTSGPSISPANVPQPPAAVMPPAPAPSPVTPAPSAPIATPAPPAVATPVSAPEVASTQPPADAYGQAASNLVAGTVLGQTIDQIIEMGGGSWDRDTVIRAMRAAFNNPERAVEYLYNGIPDSAEVAAPPAWPPAPASAVTGVAAPAPAPAPAPSQPQPQPQAPAPVAAHPAQPAPGGGPNAAPLDLFPQGMPGLGGAAPGALDFLRTNPQFQALRSMVQANPQILQPMLQELGKQNPQLLRLINDNQGEFLRLINEPGAEGAEGDLLGQIAGAMPHAINVTPEEREAIERLEALGFDRARVIEAFLACDRNEQLAANFLLENAPDFED